VDVVIDMHVRSGIPVVLFCMQALRCICVVVDTCVVCVRIDMYILSGIPVVLRCICVVGDTCVCSY